MTIGTAKPQKVELDSVPHHFINSHSISDMINAGEYGRIAMEKIKDLHEACPLVIAVGGSSLYLKALWEGFDEMPKVDDSIRVQLNMELKKNGLDFLLKELKAKDPKYFAEVDRKNGQRIVRALEVIRSSGRPFSEYRNSTKKSLTYRNLKIGLEMDREVLFNRINKRMDVMIEAGLFAEAESLVAYKEHNALQTVGYKEIFGFLDGLYDKDEAIRLLKRNSRRYAKRQLTWFKRYDDIHWFKSDQLKEIEKLINATLSEE